MLKSGQVARLHKWKRRNLKFLTASLIALVLACALRFIPRWNDGLAGRPQYARAMTTLMAQEFVKAAQDRFPVILLGKDDRCEPLKPTGITDDQVSGVMYVITYSEREHFSCLTTYVVPADASMFANLRIIRPEEGWTDGPRLLHPIKALAVARNLHLYSSSYLQLLHWRVTPRFPLPESQVAGLAAQHYESSSDPSVQPDARANITLDFDKARALVRQPHDRANFRLSLVMIFLSAVPLCLLLVLAGLYRKSSQYLRLYEQELTVGAFLVQDLNLRASAVRTEYFEKQRERHSQQRKEAALVSLRQELEQRLRAALGNLHDENLRQRVEGCLNARPTELDDMKQLWGEIQEALGHKTPEEKLALLLESLGPYCTDEEFEACQAGAEVCCHHA